VRLLRMGGGGGGGGPEEEERGWSHVRWSGERERGKRVAAHMSFSLLVGSADREIVDIA